METKVQVLILGIVVLLAGFIMFLFLGSFNSALVSLGAYAIIVGFIVTLFGFVEIGTDKASLRASKRKIIVLALIVIAAGFTVQYLVRTVVTPNWSFTIATDKSTYELGEPVQINVTLKNLGLITHSFKSATKDPVVVQILLKRLNNPFSLEVWYSNPYHEATEFTIPSHQSLERTFTWNQTNRSNPWFSNQTEIPGTYTIRAIIPNPQTEFVLDKPLFLAQTSIEIID